MASTSAAAGSPSSSDSYRQFLQSLQVAHAAGMRESQQVARLQQQQQQQQQQQLHQLHLQQQQQSQPLHRFGNSQSPSAPWIAPPGSATGQAHPTAASTQHWSRAAPIPAAVVTVPPLSFASSQPRGGGTPPMTAVKVGATTGTPSMITIGGQQLLPVTVPTAPRTPPLANLAGANPAGPQAFAMLAQPMVHVAAQQPPTMSSGGGAPTVRRTPPSPSTSGDDSCSSNDRRENAACAAKAGAARKTSRPKRRAPEHPLFQSAGNTNGGAVDVGRPPLYSGPTDPRGGPGAAADDARGRRGTSSRTPPPASLISSKSAPAASSSSSHQWSSSSEDGGATAGGSGAPGTAAAAGGSREQDEHRLRQRFKQINFGKVTQGYRFYRCSVPIADRQEGNERHPMTPDATMKCSKRRWDALVATWRRALHQWDENPSAVAMRAPNLKTLKELNKVTPMPIEDYLRETEEELIRIAHEVASMHSGASSSSQTAGETSLDEVCSNADAGGSGSGNTSVLSARADRDESQPPSGASSAARVESFTGDAGLTSDELFPPQRKESDRQHPSQRHSSGEDPLEQSIAGTAKTFINIVHFPPRNARRAPLASDNSTVTLTIVDHDARRLFVELQKHFDTSKLCYDRRARDCPRRYFPDMFSGEAASPSNVITLDSVERIDDFLSLVPLHPRVEYRGDFMPQIPPTPSPPTAVSGPIHNGELGAVGSMPGAVTEHEMAREVQLTPTRFLLDEYILQDLTFNPKSLETAPTPTFAPAFTGGKVTPSKFFTAFGNHPMLELGQLRETSPIGPSGGGGYFSAGGGATTLPMALQQLSPTKRSS